MLPYGNIMISTHVDELHLPKLFPKSRIVHVLPGLKHNSIDLGKICNNGREVKLTAEQIDVKKEGNNILRGTQNHTTGMWHNSHQ